MKYWCKYKQEYVEGRESIHYTMVCIANPLSRSYLCKDDVHNLQVPLASTSPVANTDSYLSGSGVPKVNWNLWILLQRLQSLYSIILLYKIIVVCPSVCPSVHYGRSVETIWPRDTRCSISGYQRLEARARQFLCISIITLATETDISILDRLYKNQATMGTYIQWPADS